MYILIKNGLIYDGTLENKPFIGDILIKNNIIEKIDKCITFKAAKIIDAENKLVTPGFIDIHRHCDLAVFKKNFGELELAQGITTIGTGVCGFSFAPYTQNSKNLYDYSVPTHGYPVNDIKYPKLSDYIADLKTINKAVNISTLQGTGSIRVAVKGYKPSAFTESEMKEAQKYINEAISCGVKGFSSGLVYLPEVYNTAEEMKKLFAPCKGKQLIYMPHMRDEASRLVEAVKESIEIAEENEMSLHISHLKALGPDNWGKTLDKAIKLIEEAQEKKGMDITVDFYPYHGTATTLAAILPVSFLDRPFTDILKEITSHENIEKIRYCYYNPGPNDENIDPDFRWSHSMINSLSKIENKKYIGKTIHHCTVEYGYKDEIEFIAHLLKNEDGKVGIVGFNISPDDIIKIAQLPYSIVISDALYDESDTPHPRKMAAFTHFLKYYVRDLKIISLQEGIHKITQMPAKRLHFQRRGVLKEGYFADILIFDIDKLGDNSTFDNSNNLSTGMDYVLVNGKIAWKNEKLIGKYGEVLH
ncbi:N-acyl-D-amino-acid deacylase family protein [Fusobacterium sp.]|uniref:N-acyl-D-amino-acid deacylase family protein n=1 Tax=Fusobacterium sp. TaxID=68766 RepID=UPI002904F518|nr:amidohydrolase family protein [Fusobacterium sp.]MDU1909782.1 amidohydrolase family protein [Fusobacterium sp.]